MKFEELSQIARDCGFNVVEPLDPKTLMHMQEVRDMCAADKCRNYNKSWSCPPACGTLEELGQKCSKFDKGILLQTIGDIENSFDYEAIMALEERHHKSFEEMILRFKDIGLDMLPMGAGACRRCIKCTWPDNPCRFPELVYPSMEACGLFVSQICKDNGVPYYYGQNTMAFVSCCLYTGDNI